MVNLKTKLYVTFKALSIPNGYLSLVNHICIESMGKEQGLESNSCCNPDSWGGGADLKTILISVNISYFLVKKQLV